MGYHLLFGIDCNIDSSWRKHWNYLTSLFRLDRLHSLKCTSVQIFDPSAAVSTRCCIFACLEHPPWHIQSQARQKTERKSLSSCNWKKVNRTCHHLLVMKLGRFSSNIWNTKDGVWPYSKHPEDSWKYDAEQSIFDELRGVWKFAQTLSWVFDISFQSGN